MASVPPTRLRLHLVTFDLPNPVPGDIRYRDIDRYLRAIGTMVMPLKQTRLVLTSLAPGLIVRSIQARIGLRGGVAVVPVGRRTRIFVNDPVLRTSVRRLIRRFGRP